MGNSITQEEKSLKKYKNFFDYLKLWGTILLIGKCFLIMEIRN